MSAAHALQISLFARLQERANIATLFHVQSDANAPLPRIVFDGMETRPANYAPSVEHHLIRFSIWTNAHERERALKIAEDMNALMRTPLNLAGTYKLARFDFERIQTQRDNKTRLWHAELVFDALTET